MADDFKETEVGGRYAEALFDLALSEGSLEAVQADLASLKAMIADSRDLRSLLASPGFTADDKLKGLRAIAAAAGFHGTTVKFLGLLATNRRAGQLAAVIAVFQRLYDKHRGVIAAEVTSAIALSPTQLDGVRATLRQSLGRDPEITATVDPSILGGVKVRVGSRLFDASLKSRLDQLKFALKRA